VNPATTALDDPVGAFVPGGRTELAGSASGPLAGLSFAVKDLIDVAGLPTGAGNPDWQRTHRVPPRSAPVVEQLLAAGAACAGKTVTDELAFSLEGASVHYGTPRNPAAPGRLPGGSSSGSAAAVAAGLVNFALGTDTGGSVRVPAAFCGVPGFRPTHGRVSLEGVVPFAPSYDTVGWMARDAETLWRVGLVLVGPGDASPPTRLLWARDAFDLCDSGVAPATRAVAEAWGIDGEAEVFEGGAARAQACYRVLQGAEIWRTHGEWIDSFRPRFGDAIAARFADAATITEADVAKWRPERQAMRDRLEAMIPDGTALVVPAAPGPALPIDISAARLDDFYGRALALGAIAGHVGLPQVTLPCTGPEDLPIGVALVGRRGSDLGLLSFARRVS
jgi:amidase